ncbi:anti-sigma factor [Arthrobacter sp. TE12232]
MEHLDAELLSLLALGEPLGTDNDADHLANCPQCGETLRNLRHTVHIATLDPTDIELEKPGSQNWTAIHQALGLSPDLATDPLTRRSDWPPVASGTPATGPAAADTPQQRGTEPQAPIPLRRGAKKRHARPGLWITAVAAGIVLGTAAGWTAAGVLEHTGTPAPAPTQSGPAAIILAQTSLTPLPAHTGSGDAQVEQLPDGTRHLIIRLSNDHISGFRGVWVGSADLSKMVSLGVLANESGVFTIPAGVDLAQYPIVDISDQPYNGNPARLRRQHRPRNTQP